MSSTVEDLLIQLICLPSVNPMGAEPTPGICHESAVVDWLEEFFGSFGAPCYRWDVVPGRPNIIARFDGADDSPTLLLDAHSDTVPVTGMSIEPFSARLDEERIWGRGACDVKGGLAAMLFAFRRLFEERPQGACNVVLSCTCDEEATTLGIHSLIDAWQTGRSALLPQRPDAAIIAEPTSLDVVTAHRGVVRQKIRTHGRACHSSDPRQGINAIYRMAQVVQILEDYSTRLASERPAHPLCGEATLSVGRIDGGVSVNIVPDYCTIEVDRRLIPGERFDDALRGIRDAVTRQVDFPVEFDAPWIECPPLADNNNSQIAGRLLSATANVCGPHRSIGVPFGTHAAYTSAAGVPSVVFGPGSIAQAHTHDEWIDRTQLRQAAEILYQNCLITGV